MKKSTMGLMVLAAIMNVALAHDGGHGPKLTDSPRYGGAVAPVILAKDSSLGRNAKLLYKAELTRAQDGTVRVYFYDINMRPMSLAAFAAKGVGKLEQKKNKQWAVTELALTKEKDTYTGSMPKQIRKPFNIDVFVKSADKELLAAFDNLD